MGRLSIPTIAAALASALLLAGEAQPQPSVSQVGNDPAGKAGVSVFDLAGGSGALMPGLLSDVSGVSVVPSTTAAGATGVSYTVQFTTSSTGQLVFPGTVTLSGPAGTFTNASFTVFDVTENRTIGGSVVSNDGATVVLRITTGTPTGAGDQLRVTATNATNSTAGPHSFDVSTSSDTTPVTSPNYTLGADTTPPDTSITSGPSGSTGDSTPTFTFTSTEAGSSFQCRVDGAAFTACSSPHTTATLVDGAHTFEVRAIDAASNVDPTPANRAFTVSTAPPPPPPLSPVTLDDLPVPTLGEEVNIGPVPGSGPVLIAIPSGTATARARTSQKGLTFIPLTEARQIPIGSFLDTSHGAVEMVSATGSEGKTQSGKFRSGLFQVLQSRARRAKGLTDLRLKGGNFKRCRASSGRSASAALSRRTIRRLRASARGRFRTTGRNSSATVRGTVWETIDRCDGTLTKVRRGRVVVRDFRRRKSVTVRAGKSYLARAPV